ncbi:uncharacterized protein A4U43_C03F7220 [Asparagus officinalis]|uniref:Uncharacterized protein n=1 Tax=Asparagus officinalis TaxID=4686 RepID=A0A5P1FDA3_ASPOF|nr:uncharacterized protein A4U43_C03F7220 [Asparagus officinalis]
MIILFYIDFTVVYVSGLSGFAYDLPALTLSSSCFDSSRVIWIFNIFWIWMPNMVNGISPGSSAAVDSDRCSMILIYQIEDHFLSSLEICTMARNRFLFNLEASVRRVAVDSICSKSHEEYLLLNPVLGTVSSLLPSKFSQSPVVLIIHISQMVKNSLVILRDFTLLKEQFISSDPMDLTCNSYGATLVLALFIIIGTFGHDSISYGATLGLTLLKSQQASPLSSARSNGEGVLSTSSIRALQEDLHLLLRRLRISSGNPQDLCSHGELSGVGSSVHVEIKNAMNSSSGGRKMLIYFLVIRRLSS